MWRDSLLQVLISFLPIFLFMIWFSKPERTRYTHIFLGIACGITMFVNMHIFTVNDLGLYFDFRHIPFIIGSLYGGIPLAVCLLVIYVVARLMVISYQWEYVAFAIFIFVYIPILYSRMSLFKVGSRKTRFKIAAMMSVLMVLLHDTAYLSSVPSLNLADVPQYLRDISFFSVLFLLVTLACVRFAELSFERIELQVQLHEVSLNYRNEMRRLQQFIDNTPLMVVFCDHNGMITHVNDMALKLTPMLYRNTILHQNFSVFLDKLEMQFERNPIEYVLQEGEKITEILRVKGRVVYTVACPLKDITSRGIDGVLFIGHDVTELHRLKDEVDQMDRLSLVGQMAASITHEIRNPMAVIRGFIQLLNERSPVEQRSYFRIILDELDRANAIINDFLSLAQNRIVEKESSNINHLLNDLLPLIWADANLRGQSIDMRLEEGMDLLQMNSKEMKQLILNLARNGMEAMSDKGVLLIETINYKDTIQLRVNDNGLGISQEKIDLLFEPFYTTKTNGTGLGLALCLSIVERHNGKIHVESTVGKGTTFIVTFCKPGRNCW